MDYEDREELERVSTEKATFLKIKKAIKSRNLIIFYKKFNRLMDSLEDAALTREQWANIDETKKAFSTLYKIVDESNAEDFIEESQ
jgi:hypothetical protein